MVKEHGCRYVAYTYSEPLVWFEYLMDAGRLMREAGIGNILVTNGMVNPEPLAELLPLVDAMNIDLKSIRPEFYRDYVGGDLEAVLNTIRTARRACHVELTALLIPGRNDSEDELGDLVRFVAALGRDTVLHFSRYFPRHNATEPPTSARRLLGAAALARQELDYVYVGNVGVGPEYRDTFCPGCRALLVDRSAYNGSVRNVADGRCTGCGRAADMVL
jgi:pyruvate formate lyase activating enzyme